MSDVVTNEASGEDGDRASTGHVLFVEDDESVGVSLTAVLEMHGWRVTLVTSVAMGLGMLRERSFDAVVSDLMLDDEQGRTGFAMLGEAARLRPGITTVLITGYPSEAVIKREAAQDLASVLVKPLEIAELRGLLDRAPSPTGTPGSVTNAAPSSDAATVGS